MQWTEDAECRFQVLKTALTSDPVLQHPDFNLLFILQTGDLEVGLGADLLQSFEHEEHPILFISQKLSPIEKKLCLSGMRNPGHQVDP